MIRTFTGVYSIALLAWLTLMLDVSVAYANSSDHESQVVVSLPINVAQTLRERNHDGRGGCPEANIFVHGYHFLGAGLDRTIWFLGAPGYLCETNSFVSAIVESGGEWTIGQASNDNWEGSRMLAGLPTLFQYSRTFGHFVTSEWQFANFMYHSADGVTWSAVTLPAAKSKVTDGDCCSAASLRALCVVETGTVLVSYNESEEFHGGVWSSSIDEAFPANVSWTQIPELPEAAKCNRLSSSSFMPDSLREKTKDGAIFDVSSDRAVRIPGATK